MGEDNDKDERNRMPVEIGFSAAELSELSQMPLAQRLWFYPPLVRMVERQALAMAKSEIGTPPHLRNKPFACAAVIRMSFIWGLLPDGVAASTFQTPNGQLGYMGRLCNAILQSSGKLSGFPTYQYVGDWTRVTRKFRLVQSTKRQDEHGRPQTYPERTWTDKDAEGLGVRVVVPLVGQDQPLIWPDPQEDPFWLAQCWPMFSTLWATDPKTQIAYTAIRRCANVVMPGIMLGVPFDDDAYGDDELIDVTPAEERPRRVTTGSVSQAFGSDGREYALQQGEIEHWARTQVEGMGADDIDALLDAQSAETVRKAIARMAAGRRARTSDVVPEGEDGSKEPAAAPGASEGQETTSEAPPEYPLYSSRAQLYLTMPAAQWFERYGKMLEQLKGERRAELIKANVISMNLLEQVPEYALDVQRIRRLEAEPNLF